MASHGIIQPTVPNAAFRGFSGLHHGMLTQEMVEVGKNTIFWGYIAIENGHL
jgi:hypothetical protein